MDRPTVEQISRPIPYSAVEIGYARRRPAHERTPIPVEGDEVCCRLDGWGPVLHATVERVQPADDVDDPHLYRVALDGDGVPVLIEGHPVLSAVDDPWPTLWLAVELPARQDGFARVVNSHMREARLRGSPGWLPLDWRTRRRWLPTQLEEMVTVDG